MREIKFRGRRVDNDKWVHGYLVRDTDGGMPYIVESAYWYTCEGFDFDQTLCYEVDPATVGQFTGLRDKNGREIYEGDVYRNPNGIKDVVKYDIESAAFTVKDKLMLNAGKIMLGEAIGNIHEHPNLLGGAANV